MTPSQSTALAIVPAPDLEAEAKTIAPFLRFKVVDDGTYEEACMCLKSAVSCRKRIEEFFAPSLRTANDTVKRVREMKAKLIEPVESVEKWLRGETARFQREATIARVKAEQDRQMEFERTAEVAIAEAQSEGRKPVIPLPPPPAPAPPTSKALGIGHSVRWKWRVQNLADVPREYLILDEKLLNDLARTQKDRASVPGIEFFADTTTSVR